MGITGFIRTSFSLKSVTGAGNASGQVYKNGVAVGTVRTTSSANYQTYTEDLPFNSGDYYQIYAKHASGGANSTAIKDQLVCGSEGVGAATSGY